MAYNPDFPLMIRPRDDWMRINDYGVTELQDVFTPLGQPLQPMNPMAPPAVFRSHPSLASGFDLLETAKELRPSLQIATLYTDATQPDDLGVTQTERVEVATFLQHSDLVLYGLRRSIARRYQDDLTTGAPTTQGDGYQADYLQALQERTPAPTLCYDYATTGEDASVLTEALDHLAQEVEAACGNTPLMPLEDPDAHEADLQYLNAKQWHDIGRMTTLISEFFGPNHTGRQNVTVVAPAEDSDLFRKLYVAGMPRDNAHFLFVRPHITDTSHLRYDAEVLARGYIPTGYGPFPTQ